VSKIIVSRSPLILYSAAIESAQLTIEFLGDNLNWIRASRKDFLDLTEFIGIACDED
jgi:hypothetical protein